MASNSLSRCRCSTNARANSRRTPISELSNSVPAVVPGSRSTAVAEVSCVALVPGAVNRMEAAGAPDSPNVSGSIKVDAAIGVGAASGGGSGAEPDCADQTDGICPISGVCGTGSSSGLGTEVGCASQPDDTYPVNGADDSSDIAQSMSPLITREEAEKCATKHRPHPWKRCWPRRQPLSCETIAGGSYKRTSFTFRRHRGCLLIAKAFAPARARASPILSTNCAVQITCRPAANMCVKSTPSCRRRHASRSSSAKSP